MIKLKHKKIQKIAMPIKTTGGRFIWPPLPGACAFETQPDLNFKYSQISVLRNTTMVHHLRACVLMSIGHIQI